MAELHAAFAWLAVAGTVAVLAVGIVLAAGRTRSYALLDGAILVQAGAAALAAAVGLVLAVAGHGLRDPLHIVYAVVAVSAAIATRYAVRGHDPRRAGRWIALAGVVILGVMVRLFMTGR